LPLPTGLLTGRVLAVVTWIVVAVIVLALGGLGAAVASLGRRMRPFAAATRRAQLRAEQAERLEAGVETLRGQAEELQLRLERLAHRQG